MLPPAACTALDQIRLLRLWTYTTQSMGKHKEKSHKRKHEESGSPSDDSGGRHVATLLRNVVDDSRIAAHCLSCDHHWGLFDIILLQRKR